MGFSLRRALAGAVAGGAHAAVELADNAIKSAEHDRQLQMQFDRQKELMAMQEESAVRREQHAYDMKEKLDSKKKEKVGKFMIDGLDALKKDGIDSGSIAGQRRLAEMAAASGHQDYADKFFDNAIKLEQIESTTELRKEEMRTRAETARLGREARAGNNNNAERDDERGFAFAGQAGARIKLPSRDGKPVVFENGPAYLQGLYQEARDNDMTPKEARRLVNDTQLEITKGLKINSANPDAVAESAVGIARRAWAPVSTPRQQPAAAPIMQPAAPEKPRNYVPSIGGSQSQVSGKNSDLVSKIPY